MLSFDDKLAARKESKRPTADVDVSLDLDISAQIEDLTEALATAKYDQRLGVDNGESEIQEQIDALHAENADTLITLRFTEMPGIEWASITDRFPARMDVPIDVQYGYNTLDASVAAAKLSGVLVEDGEESQLTDEQWDALWPALSGSHVAKLRDTIWGLNVFYPDARVSALKKARRDSLSASA